MIGSVRIMMQRLEPRTTPAAAGALTVSDSEGEA